MTALGFRRNRSRLDRECQRGTFYRFIRTSHGLYRIPTSRSWSRSQGMRAAPRVRAIRSKPERGGRALARVGRGEVVGPNSVLRTRLQRPPVAPDILPRARLLDRLNEGRQRTLTLLSGRSMARVPVGGGLPLPPFRLRGGSTIPPWATFPSTPLKFRTAGFPRYGFKASMSD